MSQQSEARLRQGYTPKAVLTTCMNCRHFTFRMTVGPHPRQTELRCTPGGFAVKKMGTCREFEKREESG